ncbi:MAG: hypothetical protein FJZ58_03245, partial [Chlamydiae bacterium]|nr:hypothetical protein [Chlamydiota bacterium]
CPAISYAVKDALGTRIGEGRFPAFVLHMGLQTSFLDINVHPQKKEVRLREEKWLRQQLQEKIQEALVCKEGGAFACVQDQEWKKEDFSFSEDVFLLKEQRPASSVEPVQEDFSSYIKQRPELIGLYDIYAWVMADSLSIEGLSKEGMVIIDLCSAASRVLFDALVKKGSHSAPSQGLLIPLPFPCSSVEEALVQEKQEEWQSLGFSLEPSRQGFLINAIPASLSEQEASEFLTQLLFNEKEALLERKLAAVCSRLCHSSKNKHTLVTAQALIMTLLQSSSPSCCPLGRKIMVPMGRGELEQLFTAKRR